MKNQKLSIDAKGERGRRGGYVNGYQKPKGEWWKRYFNKRVRTGKAIYKRDNPMILV